jgi:hypothetical protein
MKVSSAYPLTVELCADAQHTRGVPLCHCSTSLFVVTLQISTFTHVHCRAITPGETYKVLFCFTATAEWCGTLKHSSPKVMDSCPSSKKR